MSRRLPCFLLVLTALAAPSSTTLAGHPTTYKGPIRFRDRRSTDRHRRPRLLVRGSLAGIETLLGRFTGEVEYLVDLTTVAFTGTLTKTAANGDRLYETVTGQFTPTGSVGEFTITGGTGRFRRDRVAARSRAPGPTPTITAAHHLRRLALVRRAGQLPGGGGRRLLERPGGHAGRRGRPLPRGRGQPPDRKAHPARLDPQPLGTDPG